MKLEKRSLFLTQLLFSNTAILTLHSQQKIFHTAMPLKGNLTYQA